LALKPVATVFSGLASKPVAMVSPGLALKSVVGFLVEPQNRQLQFGDLGLKIIAMVYWFVPQNQAGYGFSVAPQNLWEDDGVGHVSRYSGLLRVEVSRGRVSQFDLKTDEYMMAGGARDSITEVALSPS
jgi:hypothetical protein